MIKPLGLLGGHLLEHARDYQRGLLKYGLNIYHDTVKKAELAAKSLHLDPGFSAIDAHHLFRVRNTHPSPQKQIYERTE